MLQSLNSKRTNTKHLLEKKITTFAEFKIQYVEEKEGLLTRLRNLKQLLKVNMLSESNQEGILSQGSLADYNNCLEDLKFRKLEAMLKQDEVLLEDKQSKVQKHAKVMKQRVELFLLEQTLALDSLFDSPVTKKECGLKFKLEKLPMWGIETTFGGVVEQTAPSMFDFEWPTKRDLVNAPDDV